MRLRLLRLVIGYKISRYLFNQWEAKLKPIAPCTCDLSRALGQVKGNSFWLVHHDVFRCCDWWSNHSGIGLPIVISKLLQSTLLALTDVYCMDMLHKFPTNRVTWCMLLIVTAFFSFSSSSLLFSFLFFFYSEILAMLLQNPNVEWSLFIDLCM